MRDQGMKTILVSGDALVTDEYWQITGDAGEGTLMTFSPDPRKNPERRPTSSKAFKAKGIDPEGYVALHLRRRPGVGAGRDRRRLDRLRQGRRRALRQGPVQDRPRRRQLRRQGRRRRCRATCSTSGTTASTTISEQ